MKYYKQEKEKERIICLLCRHSCKLKEGQIGMCGVNKNVNGELQNLVYGHPVAVHIDPVEKKPIYHLLPGSTALSFGTVGCNFKCPFCQNWDISQEHEINENINVSPEQMVALALEEGCEAIAYTYNEPTIFFEYMEDTAIAGRKMGVKSVVISAGYIAEEPLAQLCQSVDAIKIDLKAFSETYYKDTCIPGYSGSPLAGFHDCQRQSEKCARD